MNIEGKVVWISGGASGIGRALAERFAREGASGIAIVDIDLDAASAVAERVGGIAISADVGDPAAVKASLQQCRDSLGAIDLLCLNAGIAAAGGLSASDATWMRAWGVNVMSQVFALRVALPEMIARGEGYILHTASAAGLLTNIGAAPYSVTKHAVVALAEWVSITYGDRGIGVSCLCPQYVDTQLLGEFKGLPGGEQLAKGSVISTTDVADAVVAGLDREDFLILPHEEVLTYFRSKATNYDQWLSGMRRLQGRVVDGPPPPV